MHMTTMSKKLDLSTKQKESLWMLKDLLRNNFEHYVPKLWLIETHGLPEMTIDVLDVVRFLALETGNYVHLTRSQVRRVKSLVYQGKRVVKLGVLYQELKAAAKGE